MIEISIALQLPQDYIDVIDKSAKEQSRSRDNLVSLIVWDWIYDFIFDGAGGEPPDYRTEMEDQPCTL